MLEMGTSESRPVAGRDYYDQRLVAKTRPLGKELRDLLEEDIKVVLAIANDSHLMHVIYRGLRSPFS